MGVMAPWQFVSHGTFEFHRMNGVRGACDKSKVVRGGGGKREGVEREGARD